MEARQGRWRACPSRPSERDLHHLDTFITTHFTFTFTFTPTPAVYESASNHRHASPVTALSTPMSPAPARWRLLHSTQTCSPHKLQPASGLTARYVDQLLRREDSEQISEHTIRPRPEVLPSHTVFGMPAQTATFALLQGEPPNLACHFLRPTAAVVFPQQMAPLHLCLSLPSPLHSAFDIPNPRPRCCPSLVRPS